ncbi:MAG: acyl-CoA carboxylase subunit beta [SAR202 cluster bacterium]|nr:acyl-CoA carboxylase subunit beta [SAR202 cluster bacterium]|tara:strand:+ start:5595 stop:7157 length:1563 start_codon:yes stop_codon:yes gene_type:complete
MATGRAASQRLEELQQMREESAVGGGQNRIDQQHDKGKLTARERIALLMDRGSFQEIDSFVTHRATDFGMDEKHYYGDAVVTGYGRVNGRLAFTFAHDFTILGGSVSEVVGEKVSKLMDLAAKNGAPIIGLNDSGGARIQEGVASLAAYGEIMYRNVILSGVIPQISVIMGPAAGGAVYSPALTDFIFAVNGTGQMYVTGPDVIKAAIGEEITHEELGGATTHATRSGVVHFAIDSEEECITQLRRLLSFLPQNNGEDAPYYPTEDPASRADIELRDIIPEDSSRPYNMRTIIERIVDMGDFMEVHRMYAQNVIVGFARMDGKTVGIVAQQPESMAGVLDIDSSTKAARFIRFCDAFNVPIVTLIDVPGFLPGSEQEYGGLIRHGAKLLYAYAEATVPKVSVLIRKAYGGAYIVMSSKHLRGDVNLAWPSAEIAVMGPDGAVNIIYRNAINEAEDKEETKQQLVKEYREKFGNPYIAASRGFIDDVIDPSETRPKIIAALDMLKNKRDALPPKKHGSIPL